MTSQTYQTDDGHLVQEFDQVVPEDNLMQPDNDLAVAEAPLAEPDADLTVAEHDLAEPDADLTVAEHDLAEPDADLTVAEHDLAEPDADPIAPDSDLAEPDADPIAPDSDLAEPETDQTEHGDDATGPADHEPAGASVPDYPGFPADSNDSSQEQAMADSSPGNPSLVSGAFTVPESVTGLHPAGDTAPPAGPWNEIQAMFVDDPQASIERAAGVVDDRVEELIQSLRDRQLSLQSARRAVDPGTEELRVALQHYRTFWNSLEGLPAPT